MSHSAYPGSLLDQEQANKCIAKDFNGRVLKHIEIAKTPAIYSAAISGDGELLALCGGTLGSKTRTGQIFVFHLMDGKVAKEVTVPEVEFYMCRFAPDSQRLAAVGRDWARTDRGIVLLWERETEHVIRSKSEDMQCWDSIEWVTETSFVTGGQVGALSWWHSNDLNAAKKVHYIEGRSRNERPRVKALRIVPGSKRLAVGMGSYNPGKTWGEVRLIDFESGNTDSVLWKDHAWIVQDVAVSADGRMIAAVSIDGAVRVWTAVPPE